MSLDLYLGGYAQGKMQYVLGKYPAARTEIVEGSHLPCRGADLACVFERTDALRIWNHFHFFIREMLKNRLPEHLSKLSYREQEKWEDLFLDECLEVIRQADRTCGKLVVISDIVGNGIVPLDPGERIYREMLGRLQVRMAARAGHVEMVTAGLGQVLKDGERNGPLED